VRTAMVSCVFAFRIFYDERHKIKVMPDETASQPSTPIPFNIGEEFSTPSKKLPPVRIVGASILVIGVAIAIYSFIHRPHSFASGSIDTINSVEVPGQNATLLALNITIQNNGTIPYVIHNIQAALDAGGSQYSDEPASASDFARYYQAFPDLKKAPLDPLLPEARIPPGATLRGTVMFLFPVQAAAFAARKSLSVTITPYDEPVPLVMSK